jgi:hypothetical protein
MFLATKPALGMEVTRERGWNRASPRRIG